MLSNCRLVCVLSAAVLFILVKESFAIKCWDCRSDMDTKCSDPFDNTTIAMTDCHQLRNLDSLPGFKPVCMKKKMITGSDDRMTYIRQCAFVNSNTPIGKCPAETTNNAIKIDFCEYCEHFDGCNGASSIQTSAIVTLLVPVALYAFLRK